MSEDNSIQYPLKALYNTLATKSRRTGPNPIKQAAVLTADTVKNLAQAGAKNISVQRKAVKVNDRPVVAKTTVKAKIQKKAAIELALFRKEAANPIKWAAEKAGEHIVGPAVRGVSRYYSRSSKDPMSPQDVESIGQNYAAPLLRGMDKELDLKGGIERSVKENIPEATSIAGGQVLEWLKSKGAGWENMYRGGVDKLKEHSPDAFNPVLDKIRQHPYLTPTLAVALPLLLGKLKGSYDESQHRKRVEAAIQARPLNKFL